MKDILDNPDKPWSWRGISHNKFNKDKRVRRRIDDLIVRRKEVFNTLSEFMIKDLSYACVMYL
jgi:hypothetical protein